MAETPPAGRAVGGQPRLGRGPGRLLLLVYVVFVIAALGRSTVQIAADFGKAPLAYLLSALAACFYILACYALFTDRRTLTRYTCSLELSGVLVVGALSYLVTPLSGNASIWSGFGEGYGYLPLLLPVAGLAWLRYLTRADRAGQASTGAR